MKKFLLFITVFFFTFSAVQAQDEASVGYSQGDWMLGGSVTYASIDVDGDKTTNSTINPEAHYMISDTWGIGASIGYTSADFGDGEDPYSDFGLGVHGTNIAMELGEKCEIFYRASLTYKDGDSYDSRISVGLGAGLAYHVTNKIALTMGLYNLMSFASEDGITTFSVGWSGSVANPYASTGFGVLFKL